MSDSVNCELDTNSCPGRFCEGTVLQKKRLENFFDLEYYLSMRQCAKKNYQIMSHMLTISEAFSVCTYGKQHLKRWGVF